MDRLKQKNSKQAGVTLIELSLTVVLLAIASAGLFPIFSSLLEGSQRTSELEFKAKALDAIDRWYGDFLHQNEFFLTAPSNSDSKEISRLNVLGDNEVSNTVLRSLDGYSNGFNIRVDSSGARWEYLHCLPMNGHEIDIINMGGRGQYQHQIKEQPTTEINQYIRYCNVVGFATSLEANDAQLVALHGKTNFYFEDFRREFIDTGLATDWFIYSGRARALERLEAGLAPLNAVRDALEQYAVLLAEEAKKEGRVAGYPFANSCKLSTQSYDESCTENDDKLFNANSALDASPPLSEAEYEALGLEKNELIVALNGDIYVNYRPSPTPGGSGGGSGGTPSNSWDGKNRFVRIPPDYPPPYTAIVYLIYDQSGQPDSPQVIFLANAVAPPY